MAKVGKVGEWSKALNTNKIQLLVLFLEVNVTGPCSLSCLGEVTGKTVDS